MPGYVMGDIMNGIDLIIEEEKLPTGYALRFTGMADEMGKTVVYLDYSYEILLGNNH